MAKAIIMPKFGFTQESAEIVRWIKQEGDQVDAGDPIAEVTTDKVNMEVEAPATGILAGLKYPEGATVPVTEVIAYLLSPGEKLPRDEAAVKTAPATAGAPAVAPKNSAAAAPVEKAKRIQVTPVAEQFAREKGIDLEKVSSSGPGGRITRGDVENYWKNSFETSGKVQATPAARRIASELGVNLPEVTGSGPRGRVQGEDVRRWKANAEAAPAVSVQSAPTAASSLAPHGEVKSIPLSKVRKLIGERMQRSAQEAPHIYFEADINAGPLEDLRKRANTRLQEGQARVSLTALLVRTVAWTLIRHPMLNSRLQDDSILLYSDIHIGVAVAVESGLIVPVVHDVKHKPVTQIAAELDDLVSRAHQNHLQPDDVSEGTFTISNLGMFGVDRFTAIINPPQAAILAIGRVRKVFVPDENDQPQVRSMMAATLGADHRIVDGAAAARFMADLREVIEHPEMMAL
jgi:pyruvate dehydrogenase E2 component (dihydrolipoamide acetyltransferase)